MIRPLFLLAAATIVHSAALAGETAPHGMALGMKFIETLKKGDAKAVAAMYATDATLFTASGGPMQGRAAITKDFAGFLSHFKVVGAKVTQSSYKTEGNLCYGGGTGVMTLRPVGGGGDMVLTMRFTDVQKKVHGKWIYVVDHMSMVPPPSK